MKLVSWNLNGINACIRKGLLEFVKQNGADVYCFQELKLAQAKVSKLPSFFKYKCYWLPAEKNGYSGVGVLSKKKPLQVKWGLGVEEFDCEGRVLTLEFEKFFLVNVYFPHSSRDLSRLDFKLRFNKAFASFCCDLENKKPVVIASDFNVAHTEDDLANPKPNMKNAGFTEAERDWFTSFLNIGYVDTFREFTSGNGHYTWWTYRNDARSRNIGWRIDYFVVSKKLVSKVVNSFIFSEVMGSDHCPIMVELDLKQ